jgi:hypothetical protein
VGETLDSGVNPQPLISNATCDTGDVVIEGGYETAVASTNPPPFILGHGPLPNPSNIVPSYAGLNSSAYYTAMIVGGGGEVEFRTYADCFDNPPLRP